MAKININQIENIEGEYHLMFFEGKNKIASAKAENRSAWLSFLLFMALVIVFMVFSSINKFYLGFVIVFLAFFVAMKIYLFRQKRKGKKQCIYAIKHSNSSDIIPKQTHSRASKALVESMSSTIDKYDSKKTFPTFFHKLKRKRKHDKIVKAIKKFENEERQN